MREFGREEPQMTQKTQIKCRHPSMAAMGGAPSAARTLRHLSAIAVRQDSINRFRPQRSPFAIPPPLPHAFLMRPHFRLAALAASIAATLLAARADDIVEGLSETPNAKSKINWERLMESTNTKPIVIPPTSKSGTEIKAGLHRWTEAHIGAPERARLKEASDEVVMGKFFEEALQRWENARLDAMSPAFVAQAQAIVDGPGRRPVIDFLAGMVLRLADRDSSKAYGYAAEPPEGAPMPLLLRVLAQAQVVLYCESKATDRVEEAVKLYDELLAAHLAEAPTDDEDASWIVYFHMNSGMERVRITRERKLLVLYPQSKLPEWARLTLAGDAGIALAWRKGGNGMGRPTGTREEISKIWADARAALTKAWELKPDERFAPGAMIALLTHVDSTPAELRQWFDRTIAAQFDYPSAYLAYLNALRPYNGGSTASMLAFGRACADTKRYDSSLPTRFNEAVYQIANDVEDWRSLYRNKELSSLVLECREKSLKAATDSITKTMHASQLCVEAWAAGDLDLADRALDQMKLVDGSYRYDPAATKITYQLNVDYPHVMQQVWLHRGPARQDYEAGVAAMAKQDYDAASTAFQAAIGKADPYSHPLLSANIALADFQKRFATGEWVPLPAQHRMAWYQIDNENIWDPEKKRLKLTGSWIFGRSLFRGTLGKDFEVRGHFRTTNHSRLAAGMGLYSGVSPFFTGRSTAFWWTVRVDPQNDNNEIDYAPKYDGHRNAGGNIPWAKDSAFVYRRSDNKISFFVGDQEIVKSRPIDEDAPSGEGAWGLGVLGQGKGSTSLVWDLQARRIDLKK
jgi:tetratricopeptide (TPR) repeat protein